MRNFIIALTCLVCGLSGTELSAQHRVLATTTIIYDIAKNIDADKHLKLECLMPVGGDPHIYEPTPKDAQKVAQANLILKNGLHLEGWLNKLIDNAGGKRTVVEVAESIQPIRNEKFHGSPDPHAWMDPIHGITYAENIKNAFVALDKEHANSYEKNFTTYKAKLQDLYEELVLKVGKIPSEKRVLITSHDAFRYYGKRFGVTVESALGTSTDAEVQISDMNRLMNIIKAKHIPAIFIESTINPKLLQQLAADNGIRIGGKLFSDSLGDEVSGAATYIDMLRYNTDTLVEALTLVAENNETKQSLIPLFITVLALFAIGFIWLFLKVKPSSSQKRNWSKYTIDIQNISVSYYKKSVLSNINLTLESGKLYGLLGPNGAGKSTLFKSILGLVKPDSGKILINGASVEEIRNKIAYIPQKEEIDWSFPATVIDIVLTGRLPMKGRFEQFSSDDRQMAMHALDKVGMTAFTDRQIRDLSGGQQQRVFIARALCQQAEVLMFDEPFVGVDITTEDKIVQIIKGLVAENKTVLIIHHDLSKVKDYFDNVIMINQRLIAYGDTEQIFNNENIAQTYGGRLTILQETDKYK